MKILGFEYDVKFVEKITELENVAGCCDTEKQTIEILDCYDQQFTAVVFLHELLHAILDATAQKHNEKWIEAVSRGLFQVLQDNPDILKPVKQHFAAKLREAANGERRYYSTSVTR